MSFLKDIKNNNNWNVGFISSTPEKLVSSKKLGKIQWMKHNYKDRFFADPFILDVTYTEIRVLAEEYVFSNPPGLIVELVLDKDKKELKKRYELLRLPTHLSYPAIIREDGEVYVYPENGTSGKLNIYRYDSNAHKLVEPRCILEESVADATIYKKSDGAFLLTATKFPDNQECVFAFEAPSLKSLFKQSMKEPFTISRSCSRPAGNIFEVDGKVYRPAQNCVARYGADISIMEFDPKTFEESLSFILTPLCYAYSLGLHTINFYEGLCAIDGYGYLYPLLGRLYASSLFRKFIQFNKKIIHIVR